MKKVSLIDHIWTNLGWQKEIIDNLFYFMPLHLLLTQQYELSKKELLFRGGEGIIEILY